MIITAIVQVLAIFGVPLLILKFRDRPLTRTFGPVGMAYFWGLVTSLALWALGLCGLKIPIVTDINEILSYLAIGVAIPLLLFSCSLKQIMKLTKPVLISFGTLTLSVLVAVVAVYLIWGRSYDGGLNICAMAVGMYTGGSPNFISIGLATDTPFSLIGVGNLADMIVGGVIYVFLLLGAKPLFGRFLGRGKEAAVYMRKDGEDVRNIDEYELKNIRPMIRNIAIALGCAVIGAAVGVVIWLLKGQVNGTLTAYLVPGVMITVTVLGLGLSFVPKIRDVHENTAAGQYLILVFSFALAACLDLSQISASILNVVATMAFISVITMLLQILMAKIFGIGIDCTLVTMTAGIYGPAFIPALTKQLKNDDLTAPGLICGSLGYAVGTFLGLIMFRLLTIL